MEPKVKRYTYLNKESEVDLLELVSRSYDAGRVYVNAASLYFRLDKGKDWKLAELMERISKENPSTNPKGYSQAALEQKAKATMEWKQYIDMMSDAYQEMLDSDNEKRTWESAIQSIRTYESTKRELLKQGL